MNIYFIRRRTDDLILVNLRHIPSANDKEATIYSASPLSEEDDKRIRESVLKDIRNRINKNKRERYLPIVALFGITLALLISLLLVFAVKLNLTALNTVVVSITLGFFVTFILLRLAIRLKGSNSAVLNSYEELINKARVITATFELEKIQKYQERLEAYSYKEIVDMVLSRTVPSSLFIMSKELRIALEAYLRATKYNIRKYSYELRGDRRIDEKRERRFIERDISNGQLDIYLLALYIGLRKGSDSRYC